MQEELTKVVDVNYASQRVVDFEISENSLILETETGEVLYSGMNLKFHPTKFPISSPRSIFATQDSVGVVAQNGKVYYLNKKIIEDSDKLEGNLLVADDTKLENTGRIGGTYLLRYAITG